MIVLAVVHEAFWIFSRAEQYLKEAGMEVQLFEGIEPDPSVETVMKGAAAMQHLSRTGLLQWAEVLQSMQQRQCGLNTNIQISHLKICVKYLGFHPFARKHISVQFLRHLEQRPK